MLSSLDGNSWERFSREKWEDVLKGNLERKDYLEVPLSLGMSVQEAERFITETSNFGFDYNDPENLIAIFALALNDTDEPLTEEEFGSLHLYYKNLAKKKTQKLTYNELLKSPNAAANTKVNKDSVVNNFRSVAKSVGKCRSPGNGGFFKEKVWQIERRLFASYQLATACCRMYSSDANRQC